VAAADGSCSNFTLTGRLPELFVSFDPYILAVYLLVSDPNTGYSGRYFVFIFTVLAAVVVSQLWLSISLQNQEERVAKMQLISRQKILVNEVQAIAADFFIADSVVADRERSLELESRLEKIKSIQMALVNGSELYRVHGNNSPEMDAILTRHSHDYLGLCEQLEALVSVKPAAPELLAQLRTSVAAYSAGVSEMHLQLFQENESKLRNISLQGWLLMLVTLLALVLSFLLFVRPAMRHSRQQHRELSDMNKTLQHMGAMKNDFMANLGYELKSPVEGLSNMVKLLLDTRLNEEQTRLVKGIKSGTENLSRQISDILDLSKLKKGEFEQVRSRFNVREMMDEVIDSIKPMAHARHIEVLHEVAPEVPAEINQDEFRIRQVLNKLLSNAVKYTQQGEVEARIELVNEADNLVHLRFSVKDTGQGMSEEVSRNLFRRQPQDLITSSGDGSGIALSLSKELVNNLGGRIWVESKPGRGSTFYFTVVAEAALRIDAREVALRELKALIIDDNKTSLKILVRQLSNWGIQATPFNSPDLVAEVFDKLHRFDFCIMDLEMPEMDGRMLARRIREKYPDKELPIILLSNSGRQLMEDDQALYSAYLTKPVKSNRLLDTISEVIGISTVELSKMAYQLKAASEVAGPKGLRILIAQDNELRRAVTNRTLERLGYRCEVALNDDQVIEKMSRNNYDVLVMDVHNGEINGIETTRTLQKTTAKKKMPLIIGIAENKEAQHEGIAAGMDDCIDAPKVQDELEDKINAWFDHGD
jgi:signal transduction histidine kinase/DNA-binding response OmpR family regulator